MEGTQEDVISLVNLVMGAAVERFDDAMHEVLDNIVDPNTADGVRSVTLTVILKANKDRTAADVSVKCVPKLQPANSISSLVFIGRRGTQGVAHEHNPQQAQLDLDATRPKLVALADRKAGA